MWHFYRTVMRWAFKRLYHEFAWTYDTVAWLVSAGYWRQWALTALPFCHGRVLELGFGPGHLQSALTHHQISAVGLDYSPQMVRQAARRLRRAALPARLVRGTALALPFPPAHFDTVVATFPAEYIVAPATAAEIRRVLTPTGRLVIVDAAQLHHANLYTFLIDLAFRLTLQAPVRPTPAAPNPLPRQYGPFTMEVYPVIVGPTTVRVFVGVPA